MALFRRRSGTPENTITSFWAWWADEGHTLAEQSIEGTLAVEKFARTMAGHVSPMGALGWELAAGETSEHVLVVTSEGDPALRALARRVVLAAPDADETWSFVDSRPPTPDPESVVLTAGSADIDFAQVQVAARMSDGRFDVMVFHPLFETLADEERQQVTMLALDAALGEIDSELWLGEIHPAEVAPLDAFGLMALRSVVHDLKRRHVDADGNPDWVRFTGQNVAGPLVASARMPLHPLTAPHLDTHVALLLPYADRDENGLPGEGSLDELERMQADLNQVLGARGAVVAHQSNDGVRTLHVYLDSTAGLLPTVKDAARSWEQGKATVHDMHDPGWEAVSHLRA
ncbi:MAG: DUF695 domain-containing protein [Marmoricola sp.]